MRGNLRDKLVLAAVLAWVGGCMAPQEQAVRERPRPWALTPPAAPLTAKGADASLADVRAMGAYDAAVAMVDSGQYDKAEPAFARLAGQFRLAGDIDRSSKSWFWMAYCMEKRGAQEGAAGQYRKLVAEFPASQAAKVARGRLERMGATPAPAAPTAPGKGE